MPIASGVSNSTFSPIARAFCKADAGRGSATLRLGNSSSSARFRTFLHLHYDIRANDSSATNREQKRCQ